jgi:hypothetical protein
MTACCPRCGSRSLCPTSLGVECLACGRIAVQTVTDAELATYTARAPVGVAPGRQIKASRHGSQWSRGR